MKTLSIGEAGLNNSKRFTLAACPLSTQMWMKVWNMKSPMGTNTSPISLEGLCTNYKTSQIWSRRPCLASSCIYAVKPFVKTSAFWWAVGQTALTHSRVWLDDATMMLALTSVWFESCWNRKIQRGERKRCTNGNHLFHIEASAASTEWIRIIVATMTLLGSSRPR